MPKIIELPNNRVDLVFEINEGEKTGVKDYPLRRQQALFSNGRLQGRDQDHREQLAQLPANHRHLRSGSRRSRPRSVAPLLSQARLCRRAHRLGGRRIRSRPRRASSSPSRSTRATSIASAPSTCSRTCARSIRHRCAAGSSSAPAASTTPRRSRRRVEAMTIEAAKRGYPFANRASARRSRLREQAINLVFVVEEGTRAYIERINIRGNTRTRDYVIRREFDIGEGDAYNRALIDRAERRLKNLNYFKTVKITNEPGSAPDRVVVNVNVEEMSTGEFSIAGGYSTSDGFLAEVSVAERNLLGRGQFAKASVQLWPAYARLRPVVRRALSARLSHGRRHRPFRAANSGVSHTCPTTRKRSATQFAPRLCAVAKNLRCSCAIRFTGRKSRCRISTITVLRTTPDSLSHVPPGTGGYAVKRLLLPTAKPRSRSARNSPAAPVTVVAGRLYAVLQHARQQQVADQRPLRRTQAGFRGRRRRREFHPDDRRRAQLLRSAPGHHRRAALAGRPRCRLGRQGSAHAGSLPDGPEPRARLRAGRHRPARPDAGHDQRCARRHDVSGAQASKCKRRSTSCRRMSASSSRPSPMPVRCGTTRARPSGT